MRLEARDILSVALFSALTAVGAFVRIPLPFSLVPVTLQTLFTYMAGALLGGYLGALSQLIYILLGISGLPIFAGGNASLSVLVGPTGGYLVGFIAASFVIGKMTEAKNNNSFLWLLTCMIVGTTVIYTLGVLQLMNWLKISLNSAVIVGVTPFVAGDVVKILVAVYTTHRIRRMLPQLTQPARA
jgi:biotin transport system substrate-specific component